MRKNGLGYRLNEISLKIEEKILQDEELIKLLASIKDDLSDIKEVDCPNDFVDKNIFFTIKDFNNAIQCSQNLLMESLIIRSTTPKTMVITAEFYILVHKDLQVLKNGNKRIWEIVDRLDYLFGEDNRMGIGETYLGQLNTVTPPKDYVAMKLIFKFPDLKK